ncbi:hypothetical protein, partial [Prosthecodimorpha hirschii]|uniref:hypothetical protein n=1 Tax=Prosthecodimorpha hirschii TaxID=665126 RepID=UPI001AEEC8AA
MSVDAGGESPSRSDRPDLIEKNRLSPLSLEPCLIDWMIPSDRDRLQQIAEKRVGTRSDAARFNSVIPGLVPEISIFQRLGHRTG